MRKVIFDKENEKRPYLYVAGVLIKRVDNQEFILLGKRKNIAGHGYYYLPAGHVLEGETNKEALIREIKEECGLAVEVNDQPVWVDENLKKPHHVTLYYFCRLKEDKEPQNLERERCYFWRWFSIDNPPNPLWQNLSDFIEAYRTKKLINQFFKPSIDYVGVGVVGIIVNKKKEVLLQLRGKKARNESGLWKLPGGEIEWGEKAEDALKREIKEELNIEVKILRQLVCLDIILVNEGQHWLVPFYLCWIKKGKPVNQEPDKTEKIAWFSLDSLPKNLAFGQKEVLEKLNENDFLPYQR